MQNAPAPTEASFAQFQPYVRVLAARRARRYSYGVDRRDLESYGYLGLLEARKSYRPETGVPFPAYAIPRIQWRVSDGTRLLTGRHRHDVFDGVAERTGIYGTLPCVANGAYATRTAVLACSRYAGHAAAEALAVGRPESAPAVDLEARSHREVILDTLGGAIETLPARERQLITAVYREGRGVVEAGRQLGVGRSQASRLHLRAIGRLRSAVAAGPAASSAPPVRA